MPFAASVARDPDKLAHVMARSGDGITYGELDERSLRLARLLHEVGLRPGDVVAVLMENQVRFMEVYWGVIRAGMLFTPINRFLTAPEAAYIVNDSGARVLIAAHALGDVAAAMAQEIEECPVRLSVGGAIEGFDEYDRAIAGQPAEPLRRPEPRGDFMMYSSGTTGRPKGIRRPSHGLTLGDPSALEQLTGALWGFGSETIYLSPAPLYHSAPLGFTSAVQSHGGTAVIMEHFDAEEALAVVDRHRVTHSQWVPTMFVRMLKLGEEVRRRHALTTLRVAIHAAAPCPIDVKRAMIEWWGPILYEYWGATELNGLTQLGSEEWLAHPGSVGRAVLSTLHICDERGDEVLIGEEGLIYCENEEQPFSYHNDPDKTLQSQNPRHPTWTTVGDVGRLDGEGYLYLTDRKAFMIISGGVNIYPQEIEDALVMHEAVADVAVFGVPNEEMGEEVKAVVQPAPGVRADDALAAELTAYARARIAHYKVPRSIDFIDELPRSPTGKLYKRLLRDRYWGDHATRIV
jgi:long-chain acyl-CoA synthetase